MEQTAKVTIGERTEEYPLGTSYADIVKKYQTDEKAPVILVTVNGKLRELHKKLKKDCTIEFVTTRDPIGHKTYKRSACLILLKAIYDVADHHCIDKVVIHYSVGSGYYFTIEGSVVLDQRFLDQVKEQMKAIVRAEMARGCWRRAVSCQSRAGSVPRRWAITTSLSSRITGRAQAAGPAGVQEHRGRGRARLSPPPRRTPRSRPSRRSRPECAPLVPRPAVAE